MARTELRAYRTMRAEPWEQGRRIDWVPLKGGTARTQYLNSEDVTKELVEYGELVYVDTFTW